ncbi:DJ-1 family glyoxalase III [Desulfobacter curvatus]|uniref:DJ-1 family glyoxalase III n=1 Tax=Desulfobacter curvatus TaxID=2290 RepID=UPI000370F34E|nr:DJ-1 family glyoxalase III [Desulfobacter curvatus]
MTKQVMVPLAQGIEEMEAVTIIDVLRRAGAMVTIASVDELNITAARGTKIIADCLISECKDETFDLIAIPGGLPGANNLAASQILGKMLKSQAIAGRLYGAICASPAVVLHHHGLITPGQVTCHPSFTHTIDNGNTKDLDVVVAGNCITSRGGGTSLDFAMELVAQLFTPETVQEVRNGLAI